MKSLDLRMIDLNLIERGADYNDLRKNYIIFICPFDVEEWRLEYMTLLMRDQEMIRRGREEGLQVGRDEGLQEGRLQEIFLSVQEGDYSIERAAQKAGMDIQSFEKAMVDAGYKIPECV